jgi:hypothetical protein
MSLTINNIKYYGFNEIIAEYLMLDNVRKLGLRYLFEYHKPILYLIISEKNKINIHRNSIGIDYKTIPTKYLIKFKLGLRSLDISSNNDNKINCGLQSINTIICSFNSKCIVTSYPENVKSLRFYSNCMSNFNLLKNLRYLEELVITNGAIIQNICESTDSPNSKEFELSITKLSISCINLKPEILKYFKSLTHLQILDNNYYWLNLLKLTYFPKSLISFSTYTNLPELLVYPDTPFYNFLTNQVKKLVVFGNYKNEYLNNFRALEMLDIYQPFNDYSDIKLPTNVYYVKMCYYLNRKENREKECLKLLNNNQNIRIFEINNLSKNTLFGFKVRNNTLKLNSREEILQAINYQF